MKKFNNSNRLKVSMINLPKFKIGNLEINLIQGGMGVGISCKNLASAVANCDGAGIIASVELGLLNRYGGDKIKANRDAFRDEIRATRRMSKGVVGVNIMRALTDYQGLVKVAAQEKIDLMILGAGIAKDAPRLVGDSSICLVPIVNDARTARVITKAWRKHNKVPDAFIVEGPKAGGHLAYPYDDLVKNTAPRLEELARGVISFANDPTNFKIPVPVVVAGGIYTGKDIKEALGYGASGIQMATRFVTTLECDADDKFKQEYLRANKEDIVIIKSPVGMPGRAIKNPFLEKVMGGEKIDFNCRYNCLKTCKPKESPYCLMNALIGAQRGEFKEGFAFAGTNSYRATPESCLDEGGNFITVKTLMQRLSDEYHSPQ